MSKKIIWLVVSVMMMLSLVMAACGPAATPTTPTPTSTTPTSTTPTSTTPTSTTPTPTPVPTGKGNWWDKFGEPQYGGTITYLKTTDITYLDPGLGAGTEPVLDLYLETLAAGSWTLDRKIWAFNTRQVPLEDFQGVLAESWELPDWSTFIFHIRKGIHWQDKPPVNGRELTAYDVEYQFHRLLGLGSGFTKPMLGASAQHKMLTSVNATDKYTVVFKTGGPSFDVFEALLMTKCYNSALPPEAIQRWGDPTIQGWKNAIGSGPFMLTDYVAGSSITAVKNPNYWGYDERHPQNRLPYADMVKVLIIPDASTQYAALRTGKIDQIEGVNWEQAKSLAKTNPGLVQDPLPNSGDALAFRSDKAPFTDIRVRKAMQLAIDRQTIAATFYGGGDPTPYGIIGPHAKGYYTPFTEWPKQLQEEYSYNPELAKKLLSEAGYPKGFKTSVVTPSTGNLDLLQILAASFDKIGVNMEIKVMDTAVYRSLTQSGKHDQMFPENYAYNYPPSKALSRRVSSQFPVNLTFNNDLVYDKMYDKFAVSVETADRQKLAVEADMYLIAQHWTVDVAQQFSFSISQPWLKGYSGEVQTFSTGNWGFFLARYWIDQDLKKAMRR